MSKNKGVSRNIGIDFHEMELWLKRYEKAGAKIKPAVEKALQRSHNYVTKNLEEHIKPQYLPAKGKYSKGDTAKAIKRDSTVYWSGSSSYIPVGFDLSGDGRVSLYLMYGTPKMEPSEFLFKDIYGRTTKKHIRDIQLTTFDDELFDQLYARGDG